MDLRPLADSFEGFEGLQYVICQTGISFRAFLCNTKFDGNDDDDNDNDNGDDDDDNDHAKAEQSSQVVGFRPRSRLPPQLDHCKVSTVKRYQEMEYTFHVS